jgi:2-methylcitrate dehydratase PrpD
LLAWRELADALGLAGLAAAALSKYRQGKNTRRLLEVQHADQEFNKNEIRIEVS